jgi:hypothetical protein
LKIESIYAAKPCFWKFKIFSAPIPQKIIALFKYFDLNPLNQETLKISILKNPTINLTLTKK